MALLAWDDTDVWDNATDTWDGTNNPPGTEVRLPWKFNFSQLKGGDEMKLGSVSSSGTDLTTPHTWVHEEPVAAALLNREIRDRLNQTLPALAEAEGDTFYSSSAHVISRLPIGPNGSHLKMGQGQTPRWSVMPELIAYREFSGAGTYAKTSFPGVTKGVGFGMNSRVFAIVGAPAGGQVSIPFTVPASGAVVVKASMNVVGSGLRSMAVWFALGDGSGNMIADTDRAIPTTTYFPWQVSYRCRVSGLPPQAAQTFTLLSCVWNNALAAFYQTGSQTAAGLPGDFGPLSLAVFEA